MADDQHHPVFQHLPLVGNPAAADVIYFDGPLAFNYTSGMGSITFSATRQLLDTNGQPYEDRIVTGILKAPLPALNQLRTILEEMDRRSHVEVAAAVALATKPADEATH